MMNFDRHMRALAERYGFEYERTRPAPEDWSEARRELYTFGSGRFRRRINEREEEQSNDE
jgi:hypothetical protein